MPFIPLLLLGGGFTAGFAVSDGVSNLLKIGLLAGVSYVVYTQVVK